MTRAASYRTGTGVERAFESLNAARRSCRAFRRARGVGASLVRQNRAPARAPGSLDALACGGLYVTACPVLTRPARGRLPPHANRRRGTAVSSRLRARMPTRQLAGQRGKGIFHIKVRNFTLVHAQTQVGRRARPGPELPLGWPAALSLGVETRKGKRVRARRGASECGYQQLLTCNTLNLRGGFDTKTSFSVALE